MSKQPSPRSEGSGVASSSKKNLAQRTLAGMARSKSLVSPWTQSYARAPDSTALLHVNNRQVRRAPFATTLQGLQTRSQDLPRSSVKLETVSSRIESNQVFLSRVHSRYGLSEEASSASSVPSDVEMDYGFGSSTPDIQGQSAAGRRPRGGEAPFAGMSFSEMKQKIETRRTMGPVQPAPPVALQSDQPDVLQRPTPDSPRTGMAFDSSSLLVSKPFRSAISPKQAQEESQKKGWRFKSKSSVSDVSSTQTSQVMRDLKSSSGSGSKIPGQARSMAEEALGQDFKDVRIHRTNLGPLNVEAATHGEDIFLQRENTGLDSPKTISLLGHELTHVAQSRGTTQIKPIDSMRMLPGPTIQRSVEADEGQADTVESSIQQSLSSGSMVIQRDMDLGDPAQLQDATQQGSGTDGIQQANALDQRLESVAQDMQDVEDLSEDVVFVDDVDIDEELEDEEETEVNLDSLARRVYPIIRQIISLERERLGKR